MRKFLAVALLSVIVPSLAHSCAVCFGGQADPNVVKAYSWGLFMLMGFTFAVLGAFGYAVWKLEIRQRELNQPSEEHLVKP